VRGKPGAEERYNGQYYGPFAVCGVLNNQPAEKRHGDIYDAGGADLQRDPL